MSRSILIAATALTGTLSHAGTAVPDDCRFEQGEVPGASATMACYEALDQNGDGALANGEAAALPRLENRLDGLDRDGNGTLSPDEFQAGMTTPAQRAGGKGV
ncbi:hypothetical protein [Halochromatium glycolicum]|uniref:EF-hand domain-containing protein n=1 Tax=Halochromatium glycolicum TaxID=85075 RepID=A0AAJ0U500_9GAMM|nr:hypothetical protein [Halochromatium glycolicum]MBK1705223.1 hypothetical protein [Halochromatium glycolicum]